MPEGIEMRPATASMIVISAILAVGRAGASEPSVVYRADMLVLGRELFMHEWSPNDPRARGGDGLGPVYNAKSCVACHSRGGPGGSGARDKNVVLISAVGDLVTRVSQPEPEPVKRVSEPLARRRGGGPPKEPELDAGALFEFAPSLRDNGTMVFHLFGVADSYADWRQELARVPASAGQVTEFGGRKARLRFGLVISQRNTPALFGAGLIDTIPVAVIETAAMRRFPDFPEVQGRVPRLRDGRIGRFGWKAQKATLEEFVLTACSVELGLEVPGHPQAPDPRYAPVTATGLDLSRNDCDALVMYVASLPPPLIARPKRVSELQEHEYGRRVFQNIGCATCHAPSMGGVQGLYSDLLLHDLGERTMGSGGYGMPARMVDPDTGPLASRRRGPAPRGTADAGPSAREWRTPPLWGLRDSGPYLHDGRAATMGEAVQLHGGEAARSSALFTALNATDLKALRAFLGSLRASRGAELEPPPVARGLNEPVRAAFCGSGMF